MGVVKVSSVRTGSSFCSSPCPQLEPNHFPSPDPRACLTLCVQDRVCAETIRMEHRTCRSASLEGTLGKDVAKMLGSGKPAPVLFGPFGSFFWCGSAYPLSLRGR